MAFWPTQDVAQAWADIPAALNWLNLDRVIWTALETQVGPMGGSLRVLSLLPPNVILAAVGAAQRPAIPATDGQAGAPARPLTPVEAAQIGLMWNLARRLAWCAAGQTWDSFTIIDVVSAGAPPMFAPHAQPPPQANAQQAQAAAPAGIRKLKMNLVLDQAEETEIAVAGLNQVEQWRQNFIAVKGAAPDEEEDATAEQMTAMHHRIEQGMAPYADFGVFGPFGRKLMRASKFRAWFPGPDGAYYSKELPGPSCLQQWELCWAVLTTVLLSLQAVSAAALERYARCVRRLANDWPQAWHLVCLADDKCRAEHLDAIKREILVEDLAGRPTPPGWDRAHPWSCVFTKAAMDERYWDHQVRHQAVRWTCAGSRGVPLAPDEQLATTMPSGVAGILPLVEGNLPPATRIPTLTTFTDAGRRPGKLPLSPDEKKRKREAQKDRKKKAKQELAWYRDSNPPPAQLAIMDKGAKGLGKAHSKGKGKDETCGNWNQKIGSCAAEGPCRYGRIHKCSRCGGDHRLVDCKVSAGG